MAAPSAKLGLLHELFAEYCISLLTQTDEEGRKLLPSAAESAVVRAFLKDNNVQADPDAANDVRDVASYAKQAMRDAGLNTDEIDQIASDFSSYAERTMQ